MKKLLFFFLLLNLATVSNAQTTPEKVGAVYDTATIFQFTDNRFSLNNKILKRKQLKRMLLSKPESAAEYRLFQKHRRISNVLLVTAGAAYVGSFFVLAYNGELALGMVGGGLLSAVAATPSSFKARKHLHKSVWLYNRSKVVQAAELAGR